MKKGVFYIVALVITTLAGCASNSQPSMQQLAEDSAKADKVRAQAATEQRERQQAQMEKEIAQVPTWALQAPRPDDTGVYAVGMGESTDLKVAMSKSLLQAEFGLVKSINQEISGSERSYTQDTNNSVNSEQYTALIDKLVRQVPMTGIEVVKQDLKPVDGKFHAYILLKLPYDQFNRVLQQQRKSNKTETASIEKAFDDLQSRLNQRRQQQIEDEDRQKQATQPPAKLTPSADPVAAPKPADKADTSEN